VSGTTPVHDTLNFGTAKPNAIGAPEEWQEFLQNTVTRCFPAASPPWHVRVSGVVPTVQPFEASHVLVLDHPNDTASEVEISRNQLKAP